MHDFDPNEKVLTLRMAVAEPKAGRIGV